MTLALKRRKGVILFRKVAQMKRIQPARGKLASEDDMETSENDMERSIGEDARNAVAGERHKRNVRNGHGGIGPRSDTVMSTRREWVLGSRYRNG